MGSISGPFGKERRKPKSVVFVDLELIMLYCIALTYPFSKVSLHMVGKVGSKCTRYLLYADSFFPRGILELLFSGFFINHSTFLQICIYLIRLLLLLLPKYVISCQ